eukprot:COSAG03_NODE_274_length_9561_cov_13.502114_11_plen_104_part_00
MESPGRPEMFCSNMGAMENKSLNVFNTSAVLATAEVSTDDQLERVAGIVAHEYFHVSHPRQGGSLTVRTCVVELTAWPCSRRTILETGVSLPAPFHLRASVSD